MRLTEASDAELVILFHQTNVSGTSFVANLGSGDDREKIQALYHKVYMGIWRTINAECERRGINPHTTEIKPVDVRYVTV